MKLVKRLANCMKSCGLAFAIDGSDGEFEFLVLRKGKSVRREKQC